MPTKDALLTAGLVLALLSPLGSTAQAQVQVDQPRARLGLYLDAGCALPDSTAVCDRSPLVV